MNFSSDYDFDFKSDRSNKFVPFIVGFLMYSVTIAVISAFFTYSLTSKWKDALNGRITIEFQSNIKGAGEALTEKQEEEIEKTIKSTAGIKSARRLREADILKVIEPWLNGTAIPDDFPFPVIFDAEAQRDVSIDLLSLSEKLSKISRGVRIHNHATWYGAIEKISNGLFSFAIILSILIFVTVCSTIIFITGKMLNVHHNIVKILQLIGANSTYIASQFRKYYFFMGCKSSLISIGCSLLTMVGIISISNPDVWSVVKYILITIVVPLVTTALIMATSKNTVLFFLKSDRWIN
ncbi:MAG: hypothetical protein LBF57_03655 [Holosporaceae bacterium]|jgi:cell division transport system permease protein|nr:hypothetical protein [Holosporaceae bacterium]